MQPKRNEHETLTPVGKVYSKHRALKQKIKNGDEP
jgi:hypothetical protein